MSLAIIIPIVAAVLYALSVNVIPLAQAAGGSTALYLGMRGICNFSAPLLFDRQSRWRIIARSDTPKWLLLMLGLLTALQGFGYVLALHLLPISIATPLFFLFPLFTYLIQKISQQKPLSAIALLALAGSSVGIWLLSQGDQGTVSLLGFISAITAAIAQAVINATLTRLSSLNPWQIMHASYFPPAVFFTAYLGWQLNTSALPSAAAWGWTLASALVFLLGTVLFFLAVKRLGAIRTSNVMYLEPAMAVMLSMMLHDDDLGMSKFIAITLILCATVLLEWHESNIRSRA